MKQFETGAFRMQITDDLMKIILVKRGVTLQAKDVEESKRLSLEAFPGCKFFVLMEGEEDANVSEDARRLAASEEYSKYTSALALCSGRAAMSVMGNLFLRFNSPRVPTRFFYNRIEAIDWLKAQMKK